METLLITLMDPVSEMNYTVSSGTLNPNIPYLMDPKPGFQGHSILKSNILKTVRYGTKLLKNTNRKPYTIYRMAPISMTLSDL